MISVAPVVDPSPQERRRPASSASVAPPSLRLADLLRQRAAASSAAAAVPPKRIHAVPSSSKECLVVRDNKLNWVRQGHQFPPRRYRGAVDTGERLFHLRCPCCHPRPHCISILDLRLSLTTIQEESIKGNLPPG
uniref:Uncharacterized protein n=1 Tax=Oryza punctata TaxID=4537 RepID=A0A0E0KAX7_ORYPU